MQAAHPPKPAARPALRPELPHGYQVSSFELKSGLDITALRVSALPAEVLRELQRLRQCWETGSAAPAGAVQAFK